MCTTPHGGGGEAQEEAAGAGGGAGGVPTEGAKGVGNGVPNGVVAVGVSVSVGVGKATDAASPVQRWLAGRRVLVTGATGFVGKALVEKLLRCSDCTEVLALVRARRGVPPEQRLRQLKDSPVFERLKRERGAGELSRLTFVAGDVGADGLGLSAADRHRVCAEVSLVFHAAATVRFDEPLRVALNLNTEGTRRVLDLCADIHHLEALVHVSTAFANADRNVVEERVYGARGLTAARAAAAASALDDGALDALWERVRGKHPNTYTFTKAMAEEAVAGAASQGMPCALVRPSIVTASWREPEPGWVDNVSGVTGIMMEISRGTLRSIVCDRRLVMDVIPVDIVVNTLIASAFRVAHLAKNEACGAQSALDSPLVVHCTSGERNPVVWERFGRLTQRACASTPTRHVLWWPAVRFRTWRPVHALAHALTHLLPALLVDLLLRAKGEKPIMVRICQKFARACAAGEFFALNEWCFVSDNTRALLSDERDVRLFDTEVAELDWPAYVQAYILGIRQHVLKDPLHTLPAARKRLRTLFWAHRATQAIAVAALLKVITLR